MQRVGEVNLTLAVRSRITRHEQIRRQRGFLVTDLAKIAGFDEYQLAESIANWRLERRQAGERS